MKEAILNLIKNTSTKLPGDVEAALNAAYRREAKGSVAKSILSDILKNVKIANDDSIPICQDTGTVNFFVTHPFVIPQKYIEDEITKAVKAAVKKGYLRPNAVEPVTNKNSGTGVGDGNPFIHFFQSQRKSIKINLLLKGGGSENVSAQYSLPDDKLDAHRDLSGVKKCVVDAVFKAQGRGCAPGIIGVGIGGDRAGSYMAAKKQLLRRLGDTNEIKELRQLEKELYNRLNKLDIGPMGMGGKTTVLAVKAGALCRVPASFFVSVAYMCWAQRRGELTIKNGEYEYD
jgi:fumarate hydratase class I